MRNKILLELSKQYGETIDYIKEVIDHNCEISKYKTKEIKEREVIDKASITKEELITLDYYKVLINSYYGVIYPNRSYIMTELMNIMPYLHLYNRFVIYKFDFKHFFYDFSPKKSFEYFNEKINLKSKELKFLKKYTEQIGECTPGIGLHNSLVEVCGKQFDFKMKSSFKELGLIFYARYVDDCILILDEKISEDKIENIVLNHIKKCFGNKLEINNMKTQYFTSDCKNYEIDYLGYAFQKGQSNDKPFRFGISTKKLMKYKDKINNIILEYNHTKDIELLSFRLEVLFKRIVYYGERKGDGKYRWQIRGISDSYKELKRFMNNNVFEQITNDTKKLFEETIKNCFQRNRIPIPKKVNNQLKNKKFISSFLNNKAILLHSKIGLSHNDLKKKLKIVYNGNVENYNYNELAKKLLYKIK